MTNPATIFQRTHSGREEIHQKSHGLTQSERLVLIMVDGVSSAKEIRAKLPVLKEERFERALQKLMAKELVLEVFMPLDGQAPEELERTVIDRFLQQDPMDPLTIILQDPDDELGMLDHTRRLIPEEVATPVAVTSAPVASVANTKLGAAVADIPTLDVPAEPQSQPAVVQSSLGADDVEEADALTEALRVKRVSRLASTAVPPIQPAAPSGVITQESRDLSPLAVHWGYWMIVAGLSFILGFVLARISS